MMITTMMIAITHICASHKWLNNNKYCQGCFLSIRKKQAGAEQGQAQIQLDFGFAWVVSRDKQEELGKLDKFGNLNKIEKYDK